MSRIVYIVGAGFSKRAGYPLQSEILSRVRAFASEKTELLAAPRFTLSLVQEATEELFPFLENIFAVGEPELEDVFTLLDQTIARREYCGNYAWWRLERIREVLKRAILFVLHDAGDKLTKRSEDFYQKVAAYLLEMRVQAGQKADPFSLIVLNWDSLLEDSVYKCINNLGTKKQRADVDYCCYTTPLSGSSHTPSLLQKSRRLFNIKVMKLHGSSNWLLCPNCNRLFTGLGGNISVWEQYARPQVCPICSPYTVRPADQANTTPEKSVQGPKLEPFIVTPTFLKSFDNAHIQMTWHNAYIDLMEADEIVFLGYSLPTADYHVRTLLKRAIRPDAQITAILSSFDEPKKNTPRSHRTFFATSRYRQFFGQDRVTCVTNGVEGYFRGKMGSTSALSRLQRLRKMLNTRL